MISPAELAVGMLVTVLENKPFVTQELPGVFGTGDVQTITRTDRSGYGDIHRVLAIELPFIVVKLEERSGILKDWRHLIDTRRTVLMELSKEYVEALYPEIVQQEMAQQKKSG